MVDAEKIKELIQEFFARADMADFEMKTGEIAQTSKGLQVIHIGVVTDNASLFIGEGGRNISAFEQLLRLMLSKKIGEDLVLRLDINNYRSLRDESLRELARRAARRARIYKKDIMLDPMSAAERRVIHSELSAHPDMKTESAGEGFERRVVIKYIP